MKGTDWKSWKRVYADASINGIEAMLHVLDGADLSDVCKRYGFSLSYLRSLLHGTRRPRIIHHATALYLSYRKLQLIDLRLSEIQQIKEQNSPTSTSP
jgi:hypothetical protein